MLIDSIFPRNVKNQIKQKYCFIVARELKQIKDEDEDEYFNMASSNRTSEACK